MSETEQVTRPISVTKLLPRCIHVSGIKNSTEVPIHGKKKLKLSYVAHSMVRLVTDQYVNPNDY